MRALDIPPSPAHVTLAEAEKKYRNILLVTQNVDGLHVKAGSKKVFEIHGSAFKTKCMNYECENFHKPFYDLEPRDETSACPICNDFVRPDVVLFGENLNQDYLATINHHLFDCDLFIAIGTSGHVAPSCNFVKTAKMNHADTLLINKDVPVNGDYFENHWLGDADEKVLDLMG